MRVRLDQQLSQADRTLLQSAGQLAADLGMRLFLAGGSVRDIILGQPHDDWDLVVEGDGPTYAQALAEAWHGRAVLHEPFLTAVIRLAGDAYLDIATARRESYPQPGALPVVEPAPIETDLWRRDFSINAIAVELTPTAWATVLDPTGGEDDIERRVIRALHERSFWDDATRIVRGIGFEQRLGFAIEPATEQWLREAARHGALQTVSSERLGEAILPLLADSVGPRALLRANELGVVQALGARAAFLRRTRHALNEVPAGLHSLGEADSKPRRIVACLASLLVGRGADAEIVITRLHLDRITARELRGAQRYLDAWPRGFAPAAGPGDLWQQLRDAGFGAIIALWLSARDAHARQALAHYWRELSHVKPDITTADLKALGHHPGPLFGQAIQAAIRAKLNDGAGTEEQLAAARGVLNSAGAPGDE